MTQVHCSTQLDLNEASPGQLESDAIGVRFTGNTAKTSWKIIYAIVESAKRDTPELLTIKCKDNRLFGILFTGEAECARHALAITKAIANEPSEPYPFSYARDKGHSNDGWGKLDYASELKRMGLPNCKWRLCDANKEFKLCPSYPRRLVVPADVDDEILAEMAQYRQNRRLPVLTYMHPSTKASLMVAGQPLAGDKKRCYEDERMFRSILQCSSDAKEGYIIDLRSASDAQSAKGKGGGPELITNYFGWKLVFADLANETKMQQSLVKFIAACQSTDSDSKFLVDADKADWLKSVKTTLSTAVVVARILVRECLPVVLHATTGFDQAAQVSSLAQLLMDAHYRTFDGFISLIEREWLMMGHPFAWRTSLHNPAEKARSGAFRGPVFGLFLDCVWQCLRQFPCAFEFNADFLLALVEHSQGSQFGTFLFNNECERSAAGCQDKTESLWAFCENPEAKRRFVNIFYEPLDGWIKPSFRPQGIGVWFELYGRGTPYIKFHDEVHDLLMYLKDKHDTTQGEVARLQDEYAAVLAQLPPAERAALEAGGGDA